MKKLSFSTKLLLCIMVGVGLWFALRLFLAVLPLFVGSLAILGTILFLLWWAGGKNFWNNDND